MPTLKELQKMMEAHKAGSNGLSGLTTKDRTDEEQQAIDSIMEYEQTPDTTYITKQEDIERMQTPTSMSGEMLGKVMEYQQQLQNKYQEALLDRQEKYGTDRNSINTNINDYLDTIANNASSWYKKYKDTDKLPLDNLEKKQIAAEYDARKETYGEQSADIWLDKYFKEKVATKQSWFEQATNAISHLVPAIEGGAIQAYGLLHGALGHMLGVKGYEGNQDLGMLDRLWDSMIDNPVTRYGRDVEQTGTSHVADALNIIGLDNQTANEAIEARKETATKYNPEGLGNDVIATTEEQDQSLVSSATPWKALQSGGFTALSMMVGAGEAKAAGWMFGKAASGLNWLNKTNRLIKTEKGLQTALETLKKVQNFTDIAIIPGAVGTMEGAMEGLNTKIEVERDAVDKLDNYYREKVEKEAVELYNERVDNYDPTAFVEVPTDNGVIYSRMPKPDVDEAFREVWDKYKDEYTEARRQIDWASSKAGIHNFFANSLINGMINTTLKAGIMAPRVQETIRNSRALGWAYRTPKFLVDDNYNVTANLSKVGSVLQVLKEPTGEGLEEYLQSLSNDVFSGAAENNIDEFIKNKFEGDGTVKVTESFGSDYAAALTALNNSLTNKESLESALLGAVSSSMGTVGGIGRGYHRDANGNLVQNSLLDARNLGRSLNERGEQESWYEYAKRVTPWRSGLINAYYDRKREVEEANETAATLTEWLKDPQNKAKWDGLTGTANWMQQLINAAESNDQFSYRKAQMGKAINDIFMLSKLKGTDYYDSMMQDLQRAASGDITAEDIQKLKQNGGEEYQNVSDEEIVEKVKSNANHMLGLMTTVEQEGKNLDRLLGRVDEDTKQSLIFGKIMEQDFTERSETLGKELSNIFQDIKSNTISIGRRSDVIDDDLKKLILTYGSVNKALKAQSDLQDKKEKAEKRVSELEKIDPEKTSDAQKKELIEKKNEIKTIGSQLKGFDGLYKKDADGKRTNEIDDGLYNLVLSEEEILALDPVTRAMVLAQGADRLYNATHQDIQKVDQLNLEIDEIDHRIDALEAQKAKWSTTDGKVKKGHNKQVQKNNQKIAELQKEKNAKMRQLDTEQGKQNTKSIYNSQQQAVIDNLIQQGMARDADFLDKVVDMGRLEKGIKDYHTQYMAILSDPKAFQNYVQRAKYNAQRDLTRRRAERIANIQDYKEYAQELDRLSANASQQETNDIFRALGQESAKQKKQMAAQQEVVVDENTGDLITPSVESLPKTNFERYMENMQRQGDMVRQFAKNPNLTDNDQSLLLNAMQYLSSQGVDVTDRDAAVQTLIEKDEFGNVGGKFRQFVEAKNASLPAQQRAFMPTFTSIGQIVSDYVDLLNGVTEDAVSKGNISPTVTADQSAAVPPQPTVTITPSPNSPAPAVQSPSAAPIEAQQPQGPSLFDIGGATPESGHFVDSNGTVATGTQTAAAQERQSNPATEKPALQLLFEAVTTPEIAQMVSTSSGIIDNSNNDETVKDIARQYLEEVAVNSNERYATIDDLLTAIQEQINRLKTMSSQQGKTDNDFSKAAGLLQKVYGSLNSKKIRGREKTLPPPSSRPSDPRAGWIMTANIAYMEKMNPDAWAVKFFYDHEIEENTRKMYEDGTIDRNTSIYFITDSEWSAEVTKQMTPTKEMLSINPNARQYDTLTDMPIVAAVRVDAPLNPATTTAIEVDGLWYQPIGIMPSSKAKDQGAARTFDIRNKASQEAGRHLVTEDGLPNSNPLTTRVHGVNWLRAHHPDASSDTNRQNSAENNTNVVEDILKSLPRETEDKLKAMPREQMLEDPEYIEARNKFLNGLSWRSEGDALIFTPNALKQGETGNPMFVFDKPMSETKGRAFDKTLPEVLSSGSNEELRAFNSRTQRLYDEVIRPLFQYLPHSPVTNKGDRVDKSARIITQEDLIANPNVYREEAERLTKLLNGFSGTDDTKGIRGVSDFIYVNPASGWTFKVTAPDALQVAGDMASSQTVFKVFFVNQDSTIAPIELGTINAGQKDTDSAFELLRNIMWDSQTGSIRDFLNWQKPKGDAQNLNNPDKSKSTMARQNYAAIVDDGILTIAGSSIVYDHDGVELQAPISNEGRIVYPTTIVANPTNAQPSAPVNVTPQSNGSIVTNSGEEIEPDSGAKMNNTSLPTPNESEKLKKAKAVTEKIIADSKDFMLSEDETYYYITDKATGDRIKYLRVTSVIRADRTAPQGSKDYGVWGTPSSAVGNTVDSITRDFFAGNLRESYPNVTKEALNNFLHQLEIFKADLDSKGIHIVPNGVVAHGNIRMTEENGSSHDVKVAGTLDLFGYDDGGNFYIFDMKTTRDHSADKLEKEKAKWSRQISLYADLLKQSYPDFNIDVNNLRIIPINVDYPTPMGSSNEHLDPNGPQYTVEDGQLQMTYRGTDTPQKFDGTNPIMRSTEVNGQFEPGYTRFDINWNNLSDEEKEIADNLIEQTAGTTTVEQTPQTAQVETPVQRRSSFIAPDTYIDDYDQDTKEPTPMPPPIVPNGQKSVLPSWSNLSAEQRQSMIDIYGIDNADDYNELLNDPATAEGVAHDLGCKGIL